MPPFNAPFEPVALPGEAVKLSPSGAVFEVKAVEQMGRIGPVDYGSAAANDTATESGSDIIDLNDELDMNDATLGQFVINPLSTVEIEVRQTEAQEQRFVNSNQVGRITPNTPINQRVVYVHEDGAPHIIINNEKEYDMDRTLVYYSGFKLVLGKELDTEEVNRLPGTPAAVPNDSLKNPRGVR